MIRISPTRALTCGLFLVCVVPLAFTSPATAAARKGQLCAKAAENTQDSGLTCSADASGRLRWTASGGAPATTAASPAVTVKTVKAAKTAKTAKTVTTAKTATTATTSTTVKPKTTRPAAAATRPASTSPATFAPATTRAPTKTRTSRTSATTIPVATTPAPPDGGATTTPAGAKVAKKGQFCKKALTGQTAVDAGGVTLTCTASPGGGTPHWKVG